MILSDPGRQCIMAKTLLSILMLRFLIHPTVSTNPSDPKTNLDYFVRTIGSKDSTVSSINYINGTVYAKQPSQDLQRLFNFEGFNINRKLLQSDGSYLSLSRELVVYRNPNTGQILQVWINPWTGNANEVFTVANDPVNALLQLGSIVPYQTILSQKIVFNTDIILEYPNVLNPTNYSKYSAGPIYDATELFGFFSNLSALANPSSQSVPMVGTWIRKSQYLPWMAMSNSPGSLYYTTFSWKCNDLTTCLADDIMELVNEKYSKYTSAPSQDEEPNETSWSVFKKIIDQRRADGQPDIIIPPVPTIVNVTTKETHIDDRVLKILNTPLQNFITFNGSAWTEIVGNSSVFLVNVVGTVELDFEELPTRDGYRIQLDGQMRYVDSNGRPLTTWKNPITGKSTVVPPRVMIGVDYIVKKDFIYTMDIQPLEMVGLIMAFSTDNNVNNGSTWSTNFADIIFENPEYSSKFYGTAGRFSTWPEWMDMQDTPGNMVAKATINGQ